MSKFLFCFILKFLLISFVSVAQNNSPILKYKIVMKVVSSPHRNYFIHELNRDSLKIKEVGINKFSKDIHTSKLKVTTIDSLNNIFSKLLNMDERFDEEMIDGEMITLEIFNNIKCIKTIYIVNVILDEIEWLKTIR